MCEAVDTARPDTLPDDRRDVHEVEDASSVVDEGDGIHFIPPVVVFGDRKQDGVASRRVRQAPGMPVAHDVPGQSGVIGLANEQPRVAEGPDDHRFFFPACFFPVFLLPLFFFAGFFFVALTAGRALNSRETSYASRIHSVSGGST